MRSKNRIIKATLTLCLTFSGAVLAQQSSINTFSPYSCYGIGDFNMPGNSWSRSMGGVGVAYRNASQINYLNPASASAIRRQSFLFHFGMEGQNHYLKDTEAKSSYNSFNMSDIGLSFPVARGVGASVSVAPYSSVGYRITNYLDDPEIVGELGNVHNYYSGEGGITQAKAGFGVRVLPRLSLGAEMIYYFGNMQRFYPQGIIPIAGTGSFTSMNANEKWEVSHIYGNFGATYDILVTSKRILTAGATFHPGGKLKPKVTELVLSQSDTISYSRIQSDFAIASSLSGGLFLHTPKLSLGADYMFQNWGGKNRDGSENPEQMKFVDTHTVKIGAQYTPDRNDIRYMLRRWTYRAGLRYNTCYMQLNGHQIHDKAVTFGVGFPLRRGGLSDLDIGCEFGSRGAVRPGMIRENYFKISLGLNLFGMDDWFAKRKYN